MLHHSVLPVRADGGIVEYDSRSEIVRYRSNRLVEQVLASVQDWEE